MKEIKGNIWDFHDKGNWIVISTNGTITKSGKLVMGRGVALQAKERIKYIDSTLAYYIKQFGNKPVLLMGEKIITFPVKHNWFEKADLKLIEISAKSLIKSLNSMTFTQEDKIYLPRVGCMNGGLDWKDVKPILEKYLDERFVVCDINA